MKFRSRRILQFVAAGLFVALLAGAYRFWPILTFDDGPFLSEPYLGSVDSLQVYSEVTLHRFGRHAYSLEARDLVAEPPATVLLLRSPNGVALWQHTLLHDGPLGRVRFHRRARFTWWGGWAVPIDPEFQEMGVLYLGPLGGLKNYFHSW
jgi:hypothetical protein